MKKKFIAFSLLTLCTTKLECLFLESLFRLVKYIQVRPSTSEFALGLTLKYHTRFGSIAKDKQTNLSVQCISDREKKFKNYPFVS
jgi:hypothetical protein